MKKIIAKIKYFAQKRIAITKYQKYQKSNNKKSELHMFEQHSNSDWKNLNSGDQTEYLAAIFLSASICLSIKTLPDSRWLAMDLTNSRSS